MSKPQILENFAEDVQAHSALHAWRCVEPDYREPAGIDVLQRRRFSAIYRIRGVRFDGGNVIAKRCRVQTARLESLIYQKFFPLMRLPALRYYGILEEFGGDFCWLFLEDAAGTFYSPASPELRVLAGRWLAEAHLVAPPAGLTECLPRRDLDHYLGLLRHCRDLLLHHLRSALPFEYSTVLRKITEHLDALEQLWNAIEKICALMPPTLVHGDFVIKNIRVRDACATLLVFDWEFAGWGLPATDLAQFVDRVASPDLDAYCSCIKQKRSHPNLRELQAVAAAGNLLRWLDQINWAISGPEFAPAGKLVKAIAMLQIYEPGLNRSLRTFCTGRP